MKEIETLSMGGKIAYYRKRKGLTQQELSKKSGVYYTTLSAYENDKAVPKMDTLKRIADALDVSLKTLIPDEMTKEEKNERMAEKTGEEKFKELLERATDIIEIPILGHVYTGDSNEIPEDEIIRYIRLPKSLVRNVDYGLEVRGMSMIEEGIREGDCTIVRSQKHADNGQIVIARLLDSDEYTIKRFRKSGTEVWLEPANHHYQPIKTPFEIVAVIKLSVKEFK